MTIDHQGQRPEFENWSGRAGGDARIVFGSVCEALRRVSVVDRGSISRPIEISPSVGARTRPMISRGAVRIP
jgi:hypothetical protein